MMPTFDMIDREKVLEALKKIGPALPLQLRDAMGKGDSITIGAQLATLTSSGAAKVTKVQRGSSPFYYVPGQEMKLESLGPYLNEKDKRTFELLRLEKVIRDRSQEPLTRVSLRNIPDFAKKTEADIGDGVETFWKWYLLTDTEATALIRLKWMRKPEPVEKAEREPIVEHVKVVAQEAPKPRPKREKQTALPKELVQATQIEKEPAEIRDDDFYDKIKAFFEQKNVRIIEQKLVRKGSEYDFVIGMHTPVGTTEYFCKAKSKKKCSDGDLSSAYLQGQMKRLPVVFLTTGEVAKKAAEKTKTDYKGMIITRI